MYSNYDNNKAVLVAIVEVVILHKIIFEDFISNNITGSFHYNCSSHLENNGITSKTIQLQFSRSKILKDYIF